MNIQSIWVGNGKLRLIGNVDGQVEEVMPDEIVIPEHYGIDLERMHGSKAQYYYLSEENLILYDQVKDSLDLKDIQIKKLILDMAMMSEDAHKRSTY
ncbi:MAG: hypothetical protein KAS04_04615 [Candidatus Aenigmarchaeota archaeon]|nr:hypothetical protein [Candidatus Aenigmarchaeota archaeon]